jgi:hypothetical protein
LSNKNNISSLDNLKSNCLQRSELISYLDGTITDAASRSMEEHFSECELCSEAIDVLYAMPEKELNTLMQPVLNPFTELNRQHHKTKALRQNKQTMFAAVAGLGLLVGIAALYFVVNKTTQQENKIAEARTAPLKIEGANEISAAQEAESEISMADTKAALEDEINKEALKVNRTPVDIDAVKLKYLTDKWNDPVRTPNQDTTPKKVIVEDKKIAMLDKKSLQKLEPKAKIKKESEATKATVRNKDVAIQVQSAAPKAEAISATKLYDKNIEQDNYIAKDDLAKSNTVANKTAATEAISIEEKFTKSVGNQTTESVPKKTQIKKETFDLDIDYLEQSIRSKSAPNRANKVVLLAKEYINQKGNKAKAANLIYENLEYYKSTNQEAEIRILKKAKRDLNL